MTKWTITNKTMGRLNIPGRWEPLAPFESCVFLGALPESIRTMISQRLVSSMQSEENVKQNPPVVTGKVKPTSSKPKLNDDEKIL